MLWQPREAGPTDNEASTDETQPYSNRSTEGARNPEGVFKSIFQWFLIHVFFFNPQEVLEQNTNGEQGTPILHLFWIGFLNPGFLKQFSA